LPFHVDKTRNPKANFWAVWFRRALWLGIIQDFVLALPAIFWPNQLLALLGLTEAVEPEYASFAATVLIVLGAMYIPAAINPYKHPVVAWLSVLARPPGIIFFFFIYPGVYPLFGIVDSVLTILQIPLLTLAFYAVPKPNRRYRDPVDPKAQSPLGYAGTTFADLRATVWSDPYQGKLPYHLGLGPIKLVTFFNHSARNLADQRDLLPYFDKLIHSNGICHTGVWEITEGSPYSGYFAKGSKGLVLTRASVAGLKLKANTRRAFGFGGKLFPTMDPNEKVWPANFVTVSHLSGLRTRHIVDIESTNAPSIGLDPVANLVNRVIFRLVDTRPGVRLLHPISTLGLKQGQPVNTPDLMMIKIADGIPRVNEKDFRDELRVRHYPNCELVFSIFVRNEEDSAWNRIGSLTFTEDVVSETGDKRLHFWIPRTTT
jgi:hypothetical protein